MIDKAALLNLANPQDTVELDAGKVTVRGLSRAEVLELLDRRSSSTAAAEAYALLKGIVEPELTAEEVGLWQQGPGGDIAKISNRIMELSGLIEGAQFRS